MNILILLAKLLNKMGRWQLRVDTDIYSSVS